MTQPLVSIIILNYNAGQILLDCFESVIKTNYDNLEVIVVDNASIDESHRKCKEKFQEFSGVHRGINVSFLLNQIEMVRLTYDGLNDPSDFDWDVVPTLEL